MKSILLVGLDNFGYMIAKRLHELGHEVMAVDAQIGDATNEMFLESLGVNNFDVCIVAIDEDFQSSLETTSLLKELGAKFVVSRANREVQAKFLLRNGADEIINPEKQIAEWAAIRYSSDHILDYIRLDDGHAIYEVTVPKDWVGKSVGEIDIRKKYGINILAVKDDGNMNLSVTPDTMLDERKTMLVLGDSRALHKCFKI